MTEALLVGEDSEFESALCRAKVESGILRTPANALGQTATHLAISSPGRLQKLLAAGADPDCVDRHGLTPLMYAAAHGEQRSILHSIEHQATWHLREGCNGRTFLDYVINRGDLHVIESLIGLLREIGDHGKAFEVLNHCITYFIVQRSYRDDTLIPHRLFELGADADAIVKGQTLMHFAPRPVVSQLILEAGFTSFHIRDEHGKTPLMQVAHLVDAKTLTNVASHEQNADFTAQDARGRTALHYLLGQPLLPRIYCNRERHKREQSTRHRDMISTLDVLFQHGLSASSADSCVCACSTKGCTALTFALNHLSLYPVDCGIFIDLLQAIRHQNGPDEVSQWPAAIRRFHAFESKGLTHTCCRGRIENTSRLSYRPELDTYASARAEQIRAMTDFHWKSSGNVCLDEDIISSLASLCFLFEQQYSPLIQVDYQKGKRPWGNGYLIREVTMNCYKDWLRWCDRNFVKLDIKGGRRSYTEYGWRLVSMFEDKVEELRSGNETWYTAPEQPTETQ